MPIGIKRDVAEMVSIEERIIVKNNKDLSRLHVVSKQIRVCGGSTHTKLEQVVHTCTCT